jgi:hypothetical protein
MADPQDPKTKDNELLLKIQAGYADGLISGMIGAARKKEDHQKNKTKDEERLQTQSVIARITQINIELLDILDQRIAIQENILKLHKESADLAIQQLAIEGLIAKADLNIQALEEQQRQNDEQLLDIDTKLAQNDIDNAFYMEQLKQANVIVVSGKLRGTEGEFAICQDERNKNKFYIIANDKRIYLSAKTDKDLIDQIKEQLALKKVFANGELDLCAGASVCQREKVELMDSRNKIATDSKIIAQKLTEAIDQRDDLLVQFDKNKARLTTIQAELKTLKTKDESLQQEQEAKEKELKREMALLKDEQEILEKQKDIIDSKVKVLDVAKQKNDTFIKTSIVATKEQVETQQKSIENTLTKVVQKDQALAKSQVELKKLQSELYGLVEKTEKNEKEIATIQQNISATNSVARKIDEEAIMKEAEATSLDFEMQDKIKERVEMYNGTDGLRAQKIITTSSDDIAKDPPSLIYKEGEGENAKYYFLNKTGAHQAVDEKELTRIKAMEANGWMTASDEKAPKKLIEDYKILNLAIQEISARLEPLTQQANAQSREAINKKMMVFMENVKLQGLEEDNRLIKQAIEKKAKELKQENLAPADKKKLEDTLVRLQKRQEEKDKKIEEVKSGKEQREKGESKTTGKSESSGMPELKPDDVRQKITQNMSKFLSAVGTGNTLDKELLVTIARDAGLEKHIEEVIKVLETEKNIRIVNEEYSSTPSLSKTFSLSADLKNTTASSALNRAWISNSTGGISYATLIDPQKAVSTLQRDFAKAAPLKETGPAKAPEPESALKFNPVTGVPGS